MTFIKQCGFKFTKNTAGADKLFAQLAQRKASGFGISGGRPVGNTAVKGYSTSGGRPVYTTADKSLGPLGEGARGPLHTSGVGLCGLLHCRGGAGGWGLVPAERIYQTAR